MSKSYKPSRAEQEDRLHDKAYLKHVAEKEAQRLLSMQRKLDEYRRLKGEIE